VILGFAVVATLRLGSEGALGGQVVGQLAAVVAPASLHEVF